MQNRIELVQDSISMSADFADRLLASKNGDACMLYLYLLRHNGYYNDSEIAKQLGLNQHQIDTAMAYLNELGVKTGYKTEHDLLAEKNPAYEQTPKYSDLDLQQALQNQNDFNILYSKAKEIFNVPSLRNGDIKILLELYDHLGLPIDVIVYIIEYECQEYRKKYGKLKNPPMSFVRRRAYEWKKQGLDTFERIDEFIKRKQYYDSLTGNILNNALGFYGRKATPEEEKFIQSWLDMGFNADVIKYAYDKTKTRIPEQNGLQQLNYCTGILKNWHNKKAHTLEEVKQIDESSRKVTKSKNNNNNPYSVGLTPKNELTQQDKERNQREADETIKFIDEMLNQI